MTMFVVANLGDAALSIVSGTVNAGGTVSTGGVLFVNNTTSNPITLTLATDLAPFILVKDVAGNADTYPITISCASGIDAGTTFVLAIPYQWAWLFWNGSSYSVIG